MQKKQKHLCTFDYNIRRLLDYRCLTECVTSFLGRIGLETSGTRQALSD